MDTWKEAASQNRISLPRLVEFNWALQVTKASNEVINDFVEALLVLNCFFILDSKHEYSECSNDYANRK